MHLKKILLTLTAILLFVVNSAPVASPGGRMSSMSNRENDYRFGEQVGSGFYGIVHNATKISTGNVVAIKVPRRERNSAVSNVFFMKEKKILKVQSLCLIITRNSKVSPMSLL
jgi:hypothetical protein